LHSFFLAIPLSLVLLSLSSFSYLYPIPFNIHLLRPPSFSSSQTPIVRTSTGKELAGAVEHGVEAWYGVRYAKAKRFERSETVRLEGTLKDNESSLHFQGGSWKCAGRAREGKSREDCLT
jgi:hypothetical protein